jgi:hypothetical protein
LSRNKTVLHSLANPSFMPDRQTVDKAAVPQVDEISKENALWSRNSSGDVLRRNEILIVAAGAAPEMQLVSGRTAENFTTIQERRASTPLGLHSSGRHTCQVSAHCLA